MKLTEEDILKNWNELLRITKKTFSGERKDNVLKLYEHFENRMCLTPASSFNHLHNAFPGGYVDHVLRVIEMSKKIYNLWKENGANINFTEEEVVFAAMFHDLGKVGDLKFDFYVPNESEWHRNNQGRMYDVNREIESGISTSNMTFFLLSQFEVKYTLNEMMGIVYADGMYSEGNRQYLMTFDAHKKIKTNIAFIIHEADFLALHIERSRWLNETNGGITSSNNEPKEKKYVTKKNFVELAKTSAGKLEDKSKMFEELFGGK
jgi:hypothetical protein